MSRIRRLREVEREYALLNTPFMRYTAFISYNSADDRWAKWLQRKLETYNMPTVIRNEKDVVVRKDKKREKFRVFRYRANLNTVSLSNGLSQELDESRWLIVICTPNSAKSKWVGKEIQHFIDTGRKNRIIPFIVNGESYSGGPDECLHPVLRAAFPDRDILGANINDYGDAPFFLKKRKALIRVVSYLIEIPDAYNYLWNHHRWHLLANAVIVALGAVLVLSAVLLALKHNRSFDSGIRLYDQTLENPFLPSPDSVRISLLLDNETKELVLTSVDTSSVFMNIPGKYANHKLPLKVEAFGYQYIDTVVTIRRNGDNEIGMRRDDTFGILAGTIVDENNCAVADARIEVEGCVALSSADGQFEVSIPIEKQRPCPHVIISKPGFRTEEYRSASIGRRWRVLLIRER